MDVFGLRQGVTNDYAAYVRSFIRIADDRISQRVSAELDAGVLWPDPLVQLNPSFEPGKTIEQLVTEGVLHPESDRAFRLFKSTSEERALRLHKHQEDAIRRAQTGANYVLTTGTGSGKSLAYIVPIVDHVLRTGSGRGIRAIVVYPMNALANSQYGELEKFLCRGYPDGHGPVTFAKYTGQESDDERERILASPPDILLTNFVMLELIMTRPFEAPLIRAAQGLRFLVLDELHTYRGRQGADVALLLRRVRDRLAARELQMVGTSATVAGLGTLAEQQEQVALVATLIFGAKVEPQNVIGETLRRATPERELTDAGYRSELSARIADRGRAIPLTYDEFIRDPLAIWIETTFGLRKEHPSERFVRAEPRSITGPTGAARELSDATGLAEEECVRAIQEALLAGYRCTNPETGFPAFAFRLHQFISRGDTVYASLEREDRRYITLNGQRFVPDDRERVLLPLVFCRDCGQEYYCVSAHRRADDQRRAFTSRDLYLRTPEDGAEPGFLFLSTSQPWPDDLDEMLDRLPEEWIEEHRSVQRVKPSRRDDLPVPINVLPSGIEDPQGLRLHFVPAPFRFCMNCGVSYGSTRSSDFARLSSLGTEGRSTATTILSLAAIRGLKATAGLPVRARKLLSFTDNRQDAALQAGHFNDFVEIGLLRAALFRACLDAGPTGISHDELGQRVADALELPLEAYASDPSVRFQAASETKRALRQVLGYRLYRDLRRGWRITSPNLEQCGLLEIRYPALDELSRAPDVWERSHPALRSATPETRQAVARTLLDFMRRELAIKVDYLQPDFQERMQQQSAQKLTSPWAIDEQERLEHAATLYPRPSRPHDFGGDVYLSPRSGFGQYLRRAITFAGFDHPVRTDDTAEIIRDLLEALRVGGLVEITSPPRNDDEVPGYQLPASAMTWAAGNGSRPFYDPIRVPRQSSAGGYVNPFFVQFYRAVAGECRGLEAREHTAQVSYDLRVDREERFRDARLPIMYCSPTMELGVDIAELNVVHLRNVPPTPANYAQRSGRAGRSGQPALVLAYCSTGSPHDQYFFRRPQSMVAGAVSPPRLDLSNEDLIRAHVHAIWLAETGQYLGRSLKDILDLAGDRPTTELQPHVRDALSRPDAGDRARRRAEAVLASIAQQLADTDWHSARWLEDAVRQAPRAFDEACNRWRSLYRAALTQAQTQTRIIHDATRSADEKREAERLRREAEAQLKLLTESENVLQSDFYTYRYFASEAFLPGYSFPRLPISAYIPGRRLASGRDEYLSRPRFLAISEFGPRSFVYHEGARYLISKVIMPVGDENLLTASAKSCPRCGYFHLIPNGVGPDLCQNCGTALGAALRQLLRMENVSTRRRDRITSDEEERLRLGYELRTGFAFSEAGGRRRVRRAEAHVDGRLLLTLQYGQAATIWRINLGWRRRANRDQVGFVLDLERGYWARNQVIEEDDGDPLSPQTARVIPYVEDRRNCLVLEPNAQLSLSAMASLQASLKNAIQVRYQLEENELSAEPLPSSDNRRLLLFYEAAEGGAGVLRRLLDGSRALGELAHEALSLCHFDPDTGADRQRAPRSRENCTAACYDCLMSYANQPDHPLLDRHGIKELLAQMRTAEVTTAPADQPRAEFLAQLERKTGSELERKWLRFIGERGCRLPTDSNVRVDECETRPDFLYREHQAAVYVDGPVHDYPERQERDVAQTERMEDAGFTVIRFHHEEEWEAKLRRFPHVFGFPQ